MNIRPLGDRLLVKPQVEEEKTASGKYNIADLQRMPLNDLISFFVALILTF
jgi:co-chaperonin GroES (HSP10)